MEVQGTFLSLLGPTATGQAATQSLKLVMPVELECKAALR